jgi:hypothetical protein
MAAELRRIAIGFSDGQSLEVRVLEEVYRALREALTEGRERWHEVLAQDSEVLVDLGRVVYLRLATEEHRVGF